MNIFKKLFKKKSYFEVKYEGFCEKCVYNDETCSMCNGCKTVDKKPSNFKSR